MESQPQNPEFSNNPESFHPCIMGQLMRFGYRSNFDNCSDEPANVCSLPRTFPANTCSSWTGYTFSDPKQDFLSHWIAAYTENTR